MRQILIALSAMLGLTLALILGLPATSSAQTNLSTTEPYPSDSSEPAMVLARASYRSTIRGVAPRLQVSDTVTITEATESAPLPTLSAPIGLISPTISNPEPVATSTPAIEPADDEAVIPTATPSPTPSPTPAGSPADAIAAPSTMDGTILANRTDANVQFFLEGSTYALAPQRSTGLTLPRVTGVLNLYTCEATQTGDDCFWDPFLLDRDGFYEVIYGSEIGRVSFVTLREAGAPPTDQIWIQNRTDQPESVVYNSVVYEISPSGVHEFAVANDQVPTFFLRTCIGSGEDFSCEWAPAIAEQGFYYGLEELETAGALPGSRLSMLQLDPIISGDGATIGAPKQILCQLNVPAINVRSGPGLEYLIVAKIRGTESEAATVLIVGKDLSGEWLAVDDRVAPGGWVTASSSYISCDEDAATLPVAEVTDGRLVPTPEPVVVAAQESVPAPETTAAEGTEATSIGDGSADESQEESTEAESAEAETKPPEGLAILIINNAFEQDIRFTLDQKHRVEQGPSEYDLKLGDSASLLVYPGQIPFSVSSAWRGLSDNDEFFIDADESRTLWLIFIPDPDNSGRWILQY